MSNQKKLGGLGMMSKIQLKKAKLPKHKPTRITVGYVVEEEWSVEELEATHNFTWADVVDWNVKWNELSIDLKCGRKIEGISGFMVENNHEFIKHPSHGGAF